MIRRINRLITVILIAAVSIYFVTRNRTDVAVAISPGNTISASIGVIVLSAFAFGIFTATLAAALFSLQGYLRERKLIYAERQRQAFERGVLKARALSASGEFVRAEECWEQIIKKDPTRITARIELSKVLQSRGKTLEALKVIDAARADAPESCEVLFRASELHQILGNKTAAIDNLTLVLHQEPNAKAARVARDLSMDLGRIDDALEYNTRLQSIEGMTSDVENAFGDLHCKKIIAEHGDDPEKLKTALFSHIRKYPKAHEAFVVLGDMNLKDGIPDDAAQYLVKAHKITKCRTTLLRARNIWIESGFQDKAVSLMKTWSRDTVEPESIIARLELVKTYLLAGRDAEGAETLSALTHDKKISLDETLQREAAILKALIAYRSRDSFESTSAWKEVERLELGNHRDLPVYQTIAAPHPFTFKE